MGIGTMGHSASPSSDRVGRSRFRKELGPWGLTLMTLGGIMGSGIFLASGLVIQHAGPAALLVFGVGAGAMYLEVTALGEMAAADPIPGSFLTYGTRVLGPGAIFVTGWIYWLSSVLTMSSEVTAASLFMRMWFPGIPIWTWALVYSAAIVAINFISVGGFGEIEGVMAGVKTLAIAGFITLGVLWAAHLLPASPVHFTPWANLTRGASFVPHGWTGAGPALLLALFAYAGTGIIGMAAAETRNPRSTIPTAAGSSVATVTVLYILAIFFVLQMVPWSRVPTTQSPFVAAVMATGVRGLGTAMNVALLFAVLSTMNAALYANVRVLYSLAREGHAPKGLGRLDRRGLPSRAIWASAALLLLTILLAYVLPHKAYAYLITATGFQAMFIWLMVFWIYLRYHRYLQQHQQRPLPMRLPGYPITAMLGIGIVVLALVTSPLARGELVGALVGLGGIVAAYLVWLGVRTRRAETPH